jgi:hypothetical protein
VFGVVGEVIARAGAAAAMAAIMIDAENFILLERSVGEKEC